MAEYVIEPRSVEDAHVLTRVIEAGVSQTAFIGSEIAPLVSYPFRKVKVKIREANPSGVGQFKAKNAATPIRVGGLEVITQFMELVDLEEKEVLNADDLQNLYSNDKRIASMAARNIVEVGNELRQRNVNLTEWMRWQAFRDALTITYPDGAAIDIDYDMRNNDAVLDGRHLVTVTTGWDDPAADIIGDIEAWNDRIEEDFGMGGSILHVNRKTYRYMQKNTAIIAKLAEWGRLYMVPNEKDFGVLLDIDRVRLVNTFWRNPAKVKTKHLPDLTAFFTAPYTSNGTPIAEVYDGPVVRVVGDDLVVSENPGALSEIYINKEQKTKNIRVGTARMVWIRREAMIWADVS